VPSAGDFTVSKDTVFLDSVFAGISSPTYSFKIYNRSNNTILIKEIRPQQGENSPFRLNVDGEAGKIFHDVLIPPRDSIYVFVEFTAPAASLSDPVYEEPLFIRDESAGKTVILAAFVKDAFFLYPRRYPDHSVDSIQVGEYADGTPIRVAGFMLPDDTVWTAAKPIVVYGHVGVPPGKTLRMEAGTHVYFHYNSGIIVYEDAALQIEGSLTDPVILEDDRMQPDFENVPGMWNFIWLKSGSKNNVIRHAIIKNAIAGIIAHPRDSTGAKMLDVENTRIYNMAAYGLIAIASHVEGYNVVTNNTGASAVALLLGGEYAFKHCTFANYSQTIRPLTSAAVFITNEYKSYDENGNPVVYVNDLDRCDIVNSIIYGNNEVEFYAVKNESAAMHFHLNNNLIRFNDPTHQIDEPYLDFSNSTYYHDNVLNGEPDFEDPQENKLRIGLQSAAIGIGDPAVTATVPLDITGTDRTDSPDAGAYKHTDLDN